MKWLGSSPLRNLFIWFTFSSLVGCGFLSRDFGDDTPSSKKKDDKPTPLVALDAEAQVDVLWRKRIGRGMGKKYVTLSPAVADEAVYAADAYGYVFAMNRESGELIWRKRIGIPMAKGLFAIQDRSDPSFVTGGVSASDEAVYIGTARGEVISLNAADGEENWRVLLTSEILSPVAHSRMQVYAQTSDGNLFALDVEDGSQQWVFHSQEPLVTLRGTATPVFSQGIVYGGFGNGVLVAIDAESGAVGWEQTVSLPSGTSELDRMIDVDGTPLIEPLAVVSSAHQGTTKAIRRNDGSVLWENEISSTKALQSGYNLVFLVTEEDEILALEQRDGTIAWRQESLKRRNLTNPLASGNYIFVGDSDGYLHVIAQSDGRMVARRRIDSSPLQPTMVYRRGTIYLQAQSGNLFAVELRRE